MNSKNDKSIASRTSNDNRSIESAEAAKEQAMNSMNDKSTTSDNHAACTDANGTDEAPTGAPAAKSQETLESAYEEILPIARALEPKDLILLNLDLSQVAATCVAVGNRMEKHRPFFAALPDFDMASFDGLETAGNALVRAQ